MSGHNQGGRFVVAEMKRRWTLAEKKSIVVESEGAATSISAVARKHGVAPALLFRWRRELCGGQASSVRRAKTRFVPVCLPAPAGVETAAPSVAVEPVVVEIELLRSGLRLRIEVTALRRVLDVLERR